MLKYNKDYKSIIELIILFLIMCFVTLVIKFYFKPFSVMIIIFFMTSPVYKFFLKINLSKNISGVVALLLINIIIITFIIYLGKTTYLLINDIYSNNIETIGRISENIFYACGNLSDEKIRSVLELMKDNKIPSKVITTGEGILSYVVGNICTFFILVQKDEIINFLKLLFPDRIIKNILKQNNNIRKMIITEFKLMLISTTITTIGFFIFKVNEPVFLGILCGILDILPYIGTIIVFIPIIIYNIIVNNYFSTFGIILLYILGQIIREVLEAKFLSSRLDIHPIVIFISMYLGVKIFGVLGILVGPMYSIMAKEIIYDR